MKVAVGVPEREHGVAVIVSVAVFGALHLGILAVDVVEHVGMDQGVIKPGVEHPFLLVGTTFHTDPSQIVVPGLFGIGGYPVEGQSGLLLVEILAGIGYRHERYAHPDLYLLSRLEVIIGVPVADVVARQLAAILRIELVPAVVGIPCGLRPLHLALHLPVALRRRRLADAHHEIAPRTVAPLSLVSPSPRLISMLPRPPGNVYRSAELRFVAVTSVSMSYFVRRLP